MEDIEVTQEINCTGIIPLEALHTQPHKGLTTALNKSNDVEIYSQK